MSDVVKVRRPLGGPAKPNQCLIYARGKVHMEIQEVALRVMAELAEDAKGYFDATWSTAQQMWILGERVADQDW